MCHSGEVLQGLLKPNQCPAFGKVCTPQNPLGATMVSSEGACAAYYRYGRLAEAADCDAIAIPPAMRSVVRSRLIHQLEI